MAIFWDLDNLRPPAGYETVWAYRLVEAAFEYAETAHVRAYAREGTVDEDTQRALRDVGVTFTECPRVAEGADVRLATDVVNFVRGGGVLPEDAEKPPNPAADAVARAGRLRRPRRLARRGPRVLRGVCPFASRRVRRRDGRRRVPRESRAQTPVRRRHAPGRRRGGHPRVLARVMPRGG